MTDRPDPALDPVTRVVSDVGILAILRSATTRHYLAAAELLVSTGIRVVEVTLSAADAVAAIKQLVQAYDGTDVLVGAGTVISSDQAEACIDAGAAFLVSPAVTPDVMATARIAGVAVYPGALTPTEILSAHRSGASAVKLFPASAVSPGYLKDIRGPFPGIPVIPTGGVDLDDIPSWFAAGAAAVGLGSPLLGSSLADGPDAALADRARRAVAAVAAARQRP
jgi:2-dehydro-3-deoxyphosphogluconate aldolase / (4S)-4-hydroxy-2-oxoglutarate aldolase